MPAEFRGIWEATKALVVDYHTDTQKWFPKSRLQVPPDPLGGVHAQQPQASLETHICKALSVIQEVAHIRVDALGSALREVWTVIGVADDSPMFDTILDAVFEAEASIYEEVREGMPSVDFHVVLLSDIELNGLPGRVTIYER